MERTVSLTEYFAILARNLKKIIVVGLIFAVLLGGYQFYAHMKITSEANYDPERVDLEIRACEDQIIKQESMLADVCSYSLDSLLMQLDPYNISTATVLYAVTDCDIQQLLAEQNPAGDPSTSIYAKITDQYPQLWKAANIATAYSGTGYKDVSEAYIREVVQVYTSGNLVRVTSNAPTKEQALELVNALKPVIEDFTEKINTVSYQHKLTVVSENVRQANSPEIAETKRGVEESITAIQEAIGTLTTREETLKAQRFPLVTYIKFGIIGFVLGAVIALLFFILRDRLSSSAQLSRDMKIDLLADLTGKTRMLERRARRFTGERTWASQEAAAEYAAEYAALNIPSDRKLLLTSTVNADTAAFALLSKALESKGYTVGTVGNCKLDTAALAALREGANVIAIESLGKTHEKSVFELRDIIEAGGGKLAGFVLV